MSTTPPDSNDKKNASTDDDRTVIVGSAAARTVVLPASPKQSNPVPAIDNIVALPVGARLFEFEITQLIGEGGFGIVYAAHDHSLDREVAVKEYMPSSLASRTESHTVSVRSERYTDTFQAGLKSFVNEAKLLARFDHPSLVKVFRFWEMNGTAYMAMPIYKGITLKQRLKDMDGPPSEEWLRALLAPLLEALQVIHAENCFHRDIAPDNVLLIEDERPVLLDFGAARRVIGDLTHDLTVILKPGYAPVEQYAEVKSMKQGPWTDLYALAAVVYFAITGRPPDPSVGRLMGDHMQPLREIGQGRYSEAFHAAIDTALKVHPDERPRDVEAFRALLGQTRPAAKKPTRSAAETIPEKPADVAPAPATTPPHHRSSNWITNAMLAVVLIGGGVFLLHHFEESHVVSQPVPPKEPPGPVSKPLPQASTSREPLPPRFVRPDIRDPNAIRDPQAKERIPADMIERRDEIRELLRKAQESLARNEYKRAIHYAEDVLAREPGNIRARRIKMRAHEGEIAAFDAIKIE